jgi:hypothetical protein
MLFDEHLRTIARELVKTVRAIVTIDWTVRENARANLRVLVKWRLAPVWVTARKPREGHARGCWSRQSCGKSEWAA